MNVGARVARPRDTHHGGPTSRPLRLHRSVRPIRLEATIRLVKPEEAGPARFDGPGLRRAREARGISVRALAERTKLGRHHIENIEAGRVERLPAQAYLRGYLAAIAKELRLDPEQVTRSYLDAVLPPPPPPPGDTGPAR